MFFDAGAIWPSTTNLKGEKTMYSSIFTTIANLLKPVWKWLFGFIVSLIISNAVLWLLRYSASNYVQIFNDEITRFIKEKNQQLLDQIFNVGDFLNEIMDDPVDLVPSPKQKSEGDFYENSSKKVTFRFPNPNTNHMYPF